MRTLSDPRRLRRPGAGLCMIGAPLTLFVGALLHPDSGDSTSAHIAAIAANPGRNAAYLVTLGLLGRTVLTQSDDEWEGQPPTPVPPAQPAAR